MTYVLVDIVQVIHTCPADPRPHVVDTRRHIAAVIKGGPCRQPITVRLNGITATVACGRRLPADRQCPACRITTTERTITHVDQDTQHPTAGTAA